MSDFTVKLAAFQTMLADRKAVISVRTGRIAKQGLTVRGEPTSLTDELHNIFIADSMLMSVQLPAAINPDSDLIKIDQLDFWREKLNLS